MQITKKRIKQIIQEEIDLFLESKVRITQEEKLNEEDDMEKRITDMVAKSVELGQEMGKEGGQVDEFIEKAAAQVAEPEDIAMAIELIKQTMAKTKA